MRRHRLFGLLLTLVLAAGCSRSAAGSAENAITFTDDLGREVTVQAQPDSVAAMIGSYADLWVDAGGKDSLTAAAHDAWTSFDLDLDDSVADLGEIKNPSLEVLLASEPDLVLASAKNDSNKELESTLSEAGIPVAYFDVSSFEDYLRMLKICTDITGDGEAYRSNGTSLQEEIEAAKALAAGHESPTVLYIRATGSSVSAKNSSGTVLSEMLADLNTINIADSDTGLLEDLSAEKILADDPDWIFIVNQGSDDSKAKANLEAQLTSSPVWKELTAVQEGRVVVLDQSLYNLKPNARWGQAYSQLAAILYEG